MTRGRPTHVTRKKRICYLSNQPSAVTARPGRACDTIHRRLPTGTTMDFDSIGGGSKKRTRLRISPVPQFLRTAESDDTVTVTIDARRVTLETPLRNGAGRRAIAEKIRIVHEAFFGERGQAARTDAISSILEGL